MHQPIQPEHASPDNQDGWRSLLAQLHRLNCSDGRIAWALARITPEHVEILNREGWSFKRLETLLIDAPIVRQGWTTGRAWRQRRQAGLRAKKQRVDGGSLHTVRRNTWGVLAAHRGWGHYVGRSAEIRRHLDRQRTPEDIARRLGPGWTAALVEAWKLFEWDDLRPTETQILCVLLERGPLTRGQLQLAVAPHSGKSWSTNGGRVTWPTLLLKKGLIRVSGQQGRAPLYTLAEGVQLHEVRSRVPTGIDRQLRAMGVALDWDEPSPEPDRGAEPCRESDEEDEEDERDR